MPSHKVGTREEWARARQELLEREKELGSLDEELAKQRQELPWVRVEKEYTFDTEEGQKTLVDLFEGRSQLPCPCRSSSEPREPRLRRRRRPSP